MTARTTNLTILGLLLVELLSGLGGFLVGEPSGRWVFWLHGVAGFSLVALIGWKWRIVARSFGRRGTGLWSLAPLLLAGLFLGALGTGIWWMLADSGPIRAPLYGPIRPLVLHTALGLGLTIPLLLHAAARWSRPRRSDFASRRNALRLGLVGVAGLALWAGAGAVAQPRRFTGSRERGSLSGNDFPVTQWLTDDRQRLDVERWRLRVDGLVERPLRLGYGELEAAASQRATLDCTGGWFTEQDWSGVSLAALLEAAGASAEAESVVVRSATGFSRRFSPEEASGLLLATHVGGERLSAGHGAPLRLVAPGRRGYWWVKWVVSVEVSGRPSWWQPPLPLQ